MMMILMMRWINGDDDDNADVPADGSVCVEGYVSMGQVVEQDPEAPRGSR